MKIVVCAILVPLCAVLARFYLRAGWRGEAKKAFWFKGAAGLCFLVTGLVLMPDCADEAFARRVVIGLALGLLGDQLLALRLAFPKYELPYFIAGAGAFAVGHGFYLRAMFARYGFLFRCLPLLVLGLAGAVLYAKRAKTEAGELTLPGGAYIALVTFMAAVAVSAASVSPGVATVLFAVGGVCFTVSDNLLCAYCFGQRHDNKTDTAIHVTYYLAQLCIAWSLLFI